MSCSPFTQWLTSEKLIPRLVDLLSPTQPPEIHLVAADVIKGIVAMSAPSPGASALNDGVQHVPASNCFARELASRENISNLLRFMLDEVPLGGDLLPKVNGFTNFTPENSALSRARSSSPKHLEDDSDHFETTDLPNAESATSSVVNSISIIIELIRKNNSDYFEPYLFHNLRNRLIQVQQQLHMQSEDGREVLERAMKELVDRMGVVHLGAMLEVMCERLHGFQGLLKRPRSLVCLPFQCHSTLSLNRIQEAPIVHNGRPHNSPYNRTLSYMRTLCRAITLFQYGPPQPNSWNWTYL